MNQLLFYDLFNLLENSYFSSDFVRDYKWVGHKDMNTTLKIYTKVKDREAKEELSKELGNLFPLKKYDDNINDQEHSSVNTENNE